MPGETMEETHRPRREQIPPGAAPRHRSGIERAALEDAATIARLHADGIREGFLPTLGPRFLTLLYRSMATSSNAVLLVAREADGSLVGFVAGAVRPGAFYREFLRRHGATAGLMLVRRVLRRRVARAMLEVGRHLAREAGGGPELLSIMVGPPSRRAGLGSMLLFRMEDELRRRGADRGAVVVGAGNRPARAFYERLGYHPFGGIELHHGYRSLRYEKPL